MRNNASGLCWRETRTMEVIRRKFPLFGGDINNSFVYEGGIGVRYGVGATLQGQTSTTRSMHGAAFGFLALARKMCCPFSALNTKFVKLKSLLLLLEWCLYIYVSLYLLPFILGNTPLLDVGKNCFYLRILP